MNSNCMLTLKMTKMTYLSIRDIATLDIPFITFKFTNNTIAESRVVWEPSYKGSCAFSSKGISRPSSSSLSDSLVPSLWVSSSPAPIRSSSIMSSGTLSSSSMRVLSSAWISTPPCSSSRKSTFSNGRKSWPPSTWPCCLQWLWAVVIRILRVFKPLHFLQGQ